MHTGGYSKQMMARPSARIADFVAALPLRPGMRVLEIGCGPGVAARLAAARIGRHWTGATHYISEYIDGFYNVQRRHSAINYNSPIEFELIHSVKRAA